MTVFPKEKLAAIATVATKYGIPESTDKDNAGVFYDIASDLIIDTRLKSEYFSGLPAIGFYDGGTFTITENTSPICVEIRQAINDAFAKIAKPQPKTHGKSQGWKEPKTQEPKGETHDDNKKEPEKSTPQIHNEEQNKTPEMVKKDDIKTETKKAVPIPEKVQEVKPELTSKDAIDMFRKEAIDEEQLKHRTKDESKAEKAQVVSPPAPKVQEPEPKKTVPVITCCVCGFEMSHAEAMEEFEDGIARKDMKHSACKGKKPEPRTPEVMPPESKQMSRQAPARIPVVSHTQQGTLIKGIAPSLAEIGKIKIGKKGEVKKSQSTGKEFRIPKKLDHFEITSMIRYEETGDFIPDPIMELLPKDPVELDIQLLFNDPTLNFITSYGHYQGGRCLCRGDGESAKMADGSSVVCNPDSCEHFEQKKCKPNGILSVILSKSPRLGGVYKFRTTSINSIKSILSSMFFLATQTGGVLSMIPLKLTLSPKQVTPIVKGVPTPSTIYVVNIEYAGTVEDLLKKTIEVQTYQSKMRENLVKLESTARNILTAPEAPEDQKDFAEEYYPEQVV